jgi:hypothetical protein
MKDLPFNNLIIIFLSIVLFIFCFPQGFSDNLLAEGVYDPDEKVQVGTIVADME